MVFVFGASAVSAADTNQSSDYVQNHNLSSDEPANITISGQVSYCSDGNPFEGATVSVNENGTQITNTTTLADGSYTLNFQSISKDFTLTASYNGHKPTSQEITAEANSDGSYYGTGNFKLGNNDAYVYKGWETDSSQIITFSDGTNIDGTASNARTTIASGITYATSHPGVNTVYIAPGTYNEYGISIPSSVNIYGETPNTTIIDGSGSSSMYGDGIFQIESIMTVNIRKLTLQNGRRASGGAILNNAGNLNVTDCIFKNNLATVYSYGSGGAIFNYQHCTLNVTNCTFENNNGGYGGGAIYTAANSICNVNSSTFKSNTAQNGGAIGSNGQLTVIGSNFESNSVTGLSHGGAIARNAGTCEVHFNRFYGNIGSTASEIFCGASNPSGSVNATYNWWGSNNSPSTLKFYSIVYYSPWIVLTATANPTTIKQGESSTITANLLYDNGILSHPNDLLSYYHDPANGHVPDGILATFSTSNVPSLGTLDPATSTTKNGTTTSSFRGTSAGTANINVNVDGVSKLVSVTIESVPVAADDTANTNEATTLNGNVSTNDFPSTYGTNNWNLQNPPTHGTITFNSDGSYSYTPHNDYFGQDSFTYTITDNNGDTSNTATVTIHINGIPTATNDTTNTNQNTTLNANVTSNDHPTETPNTWNLITTTSHGTINFQNDGTYTYTPTTNYYGTDTFTYTITDNNGDTSNTATVTIHINGIPTATNDTTNTNEDTIVNGNLASNDQPGEGTNIWSLVTHPQHGNVTVNPDGTFTYTPETDYYGQDNFTYIITDVNNDVSNIGTVNVTINYVPESCIYVLTTASNTNPRVGETIVITFKLGNKGPDPADNVVFTYTLPDGMELVDITQESGYPQPTYNSTTRTITWDMGTIPKIDPWLEIRVSFQDIGIFSIEPGVSTTTKNPNLSSNLQNMTINVTPQIMATTVNAASTISANTIGMENTGTPTNYIIMAFLLIMSGLIVSKQR